MHRTTDYSFLSQLNLDDEVVVRLSQLLSRTFTGDEQVLVSPLASSHPPDSILIGWDKIFNSKSNAMNDDLLALEDSNRSKFGPRSIAIPWKERRSGVLKYFDVKASLNSGLQEKLFKGFAHTPRLRPLSLDSAIKYAKNNTNSGLPYYVRKGKVKDKLRENFISLLARKDPCVLFTRTQEDKKTRPVWGYPFADTIQELKYYRPLFDYQSKLNWRSALRGPNEVDIKLTDIVVKAIQKSEKLVSIDFSAYDTTISGQLQKASFNYIKSLFQPQFHSELDEIAKRFSSISLVTPDGIIAGEHGVPSGSTFTNEVDSIAQYLIATSLGFSDEQFDIQGDDGAYRTSNPEALKDVFKEYGLLVNDEKSYVSDNFIIYCQNMYHSEYIRNGLIGGIYPTYRALNRILYLERFDKFLEDEISGEDYFSIRTIAILENCKYHPLFPELVEYLFNLDKYSLNFSSKGLNKYIERIYLSRGATDEVLNQYGDFLKGLMSFETVKLLRGLSHK